MIDAGALFVINHSGGKDSQAMSAYIRRLVPASQILVIHATLGAVEWPGTIDHIRATIDELPLIVAEPAKGFFDMVEHRRFWPSPTYRQCTSDLKRTPIDREIRRYLKAHPEFEGRVVSCIGLRAEESTSRAKAQPLKVNKRNSKAGRTWLDWLPIHGLLIDQVFAVIAAARQVPHWAYGAGMSRLSCCFCIMASRADLVRAAELQPELYRRYVETERRLDQTFVMPKKNGPRLFLEDVTGIPAAAVA